MGHMKRTERGRVDVWTPGSALHRVGGLAAGAAAGRCRDGLGHAVLQRGHLSREDLAQRLSHRLSRRLQRLQHTLKAQRAAGSST